MNAKNRVRVTATPTATTAPARRVLAAEPTYARSLMRAQLRLALGCLIGFLFTAGALTIILFAVPSLNSVIVLHMPLPWLLHAFGYYPIILAFALVYARGARRNEARYLALREGDE